jgi:hypothetical protein
MRGFAVRVDENKWPEEAYELENVLNELSPEAKLRVYEVDKSYLKAKKIDDKHFVEAPLLALAYYGDSTRVSNLGSLIYNYTHSCNTLKDSKKRKQEEIQDSDDDEEDQDDNKLDGNPLPLEKQNGFLVIDAGTYLRKGAITDKCTGESLPRMISLDLALGVLLRKYKKVMKKSAPKVAAADTVLTPTEVTVKSAFFKFIGEVQPAILSPSVYDVVKAQVLRAVNPVKPTIRDMEDADAIQRMCAFVASMRDFSSCSGEIREIVHRDLVAFFEKHPKTTLIHTTAEANVLQARKKTKA